MAGRKMVLNHCIIPTVIYFLSCWRPREVDVKIFISLSKNFLQEEDLWVKKVAKVKWEFCCLPTELGGLGILNIEDLADRLVAKWILRGSTQHEKSLFSLKGHHRWKKLPYITIFGSKYAITPIGSELAVSLWKAWFKVESAAGVFHRLQGFAGHSPH